MSDIRVVLPAHLKNLAKVHGEVIVAIPAADPGVPGGPGAVLTQRAVLDAVETRFPVLRGTIRDRVTGKRRAFIRFYACKRDLSNDPPDAPFPPDVTELIAAGKEPFLIVGAMAGG